MQNEPITNSGDLFLKLAEIPTAFMKGEITLGQADMWIKVTNAMCNLAIAQHKNNQIAGIKGGIPFFNQRVSIQPPIVSIENKPLPKEYNKHIHEEKKDSIERPPAEYSNKTPYGFAKDAF